MKSIFKSSPLFFVVLTVSLIMVKCAIIVPPSGGAVDVTPPIVKESFPPNYSSFFKDNKIRIFFNEYVQLKDYTNQITISPIPENDPDYSLKGKSIQVEFKEKFSDEVIEPIVREIAQGIEVVLRDEKVGEKVGEKLTVNQELILKYIGQYKQISIVELSKKVGIATKNIEVNIAKLKQKGLLKRIGSAKGGRWEIL